MGVKVSVKFAPAFKRLIKDLEQSKKKVRVGIFADKGGSATYEGSDVTIAEVAAIHEYGSPRANIPQRSFLRSTVNGNKGEIAKLMKRIGKGVFKNKLTLDQGLDLLGIDLVSKVKKRITGNPPIPPPLKPETIARKGSDRPLVDTGQLVNSITYTVE